jgi:hypothetical protein
MSHGPTKIKSKAVCIYCKQTALKLTDEHVVPFSLGGQHVIEKASCLGCADITKKFEQDVARGLWGDARISYSAPSRRKKQRPTHILLSGNTSSEEPLQIAYRDYPAPMIFYIMAQAGILQGFKQTHDLSPKWRLVAIADDNKIKKFESQYAGRLTAKFRHVPDSFGRLIAKIGYCQILCSLDPSDFNPICLPYILGTEKNLSYIVGGRETIADTLPGVGYFIASHFFGTSDKAVLAAEIRLFADNATPTYHVIVGDVFGAENVKRVKEKIAATYTVDMPQQFDLPRTPPDHLHWMPKIWPLNHWASASNVVNAS